MVWGMAKAEHVGGRLGDVRGCIGGLYGPGLHAKRVDELGFGYVIRFRGNIRVTDGNGDTRAATEWVGKGGGARKLA
jgi:hypothetical protein